MASIETEIRKSLKFISKESDIPLSNIVSNYWRLLSYKDNPKDKDKQVIIEYLTDYYLPLPDWEDTNPF